MNSKFLVNRSFCIRSPQDKERLPLGYHGHRNYSIQSGTIDDILDAYQKGFQVIPAEFERDLYGNIRSQKHWKSQQIFLIEMDKDIQERTLQEVVANNAFIADNAYAVSESVRSRYDDPKDADCNGELRYRIWFAAAAPSQDIESVRWFVSRLLHEFPQADPAGSNITNGAYGKRGANILRIGNPISNEVLAKWGNEFRAYLDQKKRARRVPLKHASAEIRGLVKDLNFDSSGVSDRRIPCPFQEHANDGEGAGNTNATVVFLNKRSITFFCHKCKRHETFRGWRQPQ